MDSRGNGIRRFVLGLGMAATLRNSLSPPLGETVAEGGGGNDQARSGLVLGGKKFGEDIMPDPAKVANP